MSDETAPIQETPKRPAPAIDGAVRKAMTWLAFAVLAAAILTAFVSILQVIGIWFDDQYVPIARAVLAILVALAALAVVRMLMRKPARPAT